MTEQVSHRTRSELHEEVVNPYIEYPGKPIILGDVEYALKEGRLQYNRLGTSKIFLPSGEEVVVPRPKQVDARRQTMKGLLEDLAPGSELGDRFIDEAYKPYEQALMKNFERPMYGTAVYFPERQELAYFPPPFWYKMALLTRNSELIRDPNQSISWMEQRKRFDSLVVGVAGASVGKNAFELIIKTMRPSSIKIADPSVYKTSGMNRTHIGYFELGKNKAEVAARQAYEEDPFIDISVYKEGIDGVNIQDFIAGRGSIGEPKIDILVEETDNPETKIALRQYAREQGVDVIMVTDIGYGYQIDMREFSKDKNLSLAVGVEDQELLESQQIWQHDRANRELFYRFAFKLIGQEWKEIPEFKNLVLKLHETPFAGGVPQLGIAAYAGGAQIAELIADKILGHKIPSRIFINLRDRYFKEK